MAGTRGSRNPPSSLASGLAESFQGLSVSASALRSTLAGTKPGILTLSALSAAPLRTETKARQPKVRRRRIGLAFDRRGVNKPQKRGREVRTADSILLNLLRTSTRPDLAKKNVFFPPATSAFAGLLASSPLLSVRRGHFTGAGRKCGRLVLFFPAALFYFHFRAVTFRPLGSGEGSLLSLASFAAPVR